MKLRTSLQKRVGLRYMMGSRGVTKPVFVSERKYIQLFETLQIFIIFGKTGIGSISEEKYSKPNVCLLWRRNSGFTHSVLENLISKD